MEDILSVMEDIISIEEFPIGTRVVVALKGPLYGNTGSVTGKATMGSVVVQFDDGTEHEFAFRSSLRHITVVDNWTTFDD